MFDKKIVTLVWKFEKFYKECDRKSLYKLLMHECMHQYHYRFMKFHKIEEYKIKGYDTASSICTSIG